MKAETKIVQKYEVYMDLTYFHIENSPLSELKFKTEKVAEIAMKIDTEILLDYWKDNKEKEILDMCYLMNSIPFAKREKYWELFTFKHKL